MWWVVDRCVFRRGVWLEGSALVCWGKVGFRYVVLGSRFFGGI